MICLKSILLFFCYNDLSKIRVPSSADVLLRAGGSASVLYPTDTERNPHDAWGLGSLPSPARLGQGSLV
jgi:hypothetical protein